MATGAGAEMPALCTAASGERTEVTKVGVSGAGHIGLVVAARLGHQVTCLEKKNAKLTQLREGHMPYFRFSPLTLPSPRTGSQQR
jgi:D-arabinose 1-dehydrogenase-like Zn-dependent alcohol dehydrogenase